MSDDPTSFDAFKWECRRKQIESLRVPWEGMGDMANAERAIAALTIDNLMAEVEAWKKAMQKADRDIAQLRAERDEARRRLCAELLEVEGHPFGWKGARGAEGIAERLGWDCFKEKP